MKKWLLRLLTHVVALALGFGLGIYLLPILTAPPAPTVAAATSAASDTLFTGRADRGVG